MVIENRTSGWKGRFLNILSSPPVKGGLFFTGAILVCFAFGRSVIEVLRVVGVDERLSTLVGTGAWTFLFFTIVSYERLWFGNQRQIVLYPRTMTNRQRKDERKLRLAEAYTGFAYAMWGGALAAVGNFSTVTIWIIATCCALAGGLLGHDVKRRIRRRRQQIAASETAHNVCDST